MLIRFCLLNNVLTGEVAENNKLALKIVALVLKYQLHQYVDIERQSQRIRFIDGSSYFAVHLNRLSETDRIQILKLLNDVYVNKILDSIIVEEIVLEKYNNILSSIRALAIDQLNKTRWSRLFVIPDLKYSPEACQTLFRTNAGAAEFDEMVWRNFDILLLPSFGAINFSGSRIEITNEGNGAIPDPSLEIMLEAEEIVDVKIFGTVLAGEIAAFELNSKDLRRLNALDPNIKTISVRVSFKKYGGKKFDFVRSIETREILEWTKYQETTSTDIHNAEDLFEVVKEFVKQIQFIVQEDEGYVSLTNLVNGKRILRSETEIQIQLKHWLEPMCEKLSIELDREPLTGRGPLDFKFSIGHTIKCLMEVKLCQSNKLEHGLEIQLPTYLISDKAKYGIYVPIMVNPDQADEILGRLTEIVNRINQEKRYKVDVLDIRAWKLETASKAKKASDIRYETKL